MNEEIKVKWTTELRSNRYKQGRGALRHKESGGTETHCCLGVLCDLAVEAGVVTRTSPVQSGDHFYGADGQDAFLPVEVQQWAGLGTRDPLVANGYTSLARMNDQGRTFAEIAQIIEEQL